jgi:pimeloyl-ACP methyl ester carboxylesterase
MSTASIFKSLEGEATMADWYERFSARLDFDYETRRIETSFGYSEVIVTGPEDGLPVVLFHGAMAGAPHALREMGDLPTRYRIYAVNVVGQSVRAAPTRPNPRGFGRWTAEVLDALQLPRAVVMGVSWGGYVALRAAIRVPDRLLGLILVCPAGLVRGPILKPLLRFTWPLTLYQLFGSQSRLEQAMAEVFTTIDQDWAPFFGDAIKHVKLDFSVPPLTTEAEVTNLDAPVLVFGADEDLMFPGRAIQRRAQDLFKNLDEAVLLENTKHSPAFDESFRGPFGRRVASFLDPLTESHGTARTDNSPAPGGRNGVLRDEGDDLTETPRHGH